MNKRTVPFHLAPNTASFVLSVLAKRPLEEISTTFFSLQQQMKQQMEVPEGGEAPQRVAFSLEEQGLNLMLSALSERPYKEVAVIFEEMRLQLKEFAEQSQLAAQQAQAAAGVVPEAAPAVAAAPIVDSEVPAASQNTPNVGEIPAV